MEVVAISDAPLAALGALLTGSGAVIAAIASLRRAKKEERVEADADCNDRLLDMIERHGLWADREVGRAAKQRREES